MLDEKRASIPTRLGNQLCASVDSVQCAKHYWEQNKSTWACHAVQGHLGQVGTWPEVSLFVPGMDCANVDKWIDRKQENYIDILAYFHLSKIQYFWWLDCFLWQKNSNLNNLWKLIVGKINKIHIGHSIKPGVWFTTCSLDCSTTKKIKNLSFTWSRGSRQPACI